jgi:N-acetylmuramoyl-L-alanine amidase
LDWCFGTKENGIRTTQVLNQELTNHIDELNARRQRWYKKLLSKRYRKRVVRYSLLTANVIVMVVVVAFVTQKPETDTSSSPARSALGEAETISNPLDQISAADVAVHVANATRLPEATNVANLADTVNSQINVTTGENVITAKPQIIATGLPSRRDITTYVTQEGDTVRSIAEKFGVTSDTIRWSNNLSGNSVAGGQTLYISPINGIVYKVVSGDTIESITTRYRSNREKFIAVNDLEGRSNLPVGERIIIPDGQKPSAVTRTFNAYASGFAFGSDAIYGYNGYDYGWCTWYVANRISVPTNWGNANHWDEGARLSGWTVSATPQVGAIAQTNYGWAGHVGVVDAVKKEDGRYYIKYSDMNGLAGFARVGSSDWVPANDKYENFIYR